MCLEASSYPLFNRGTIPTKQGHHLLDGVGLGRRDQQFEPGYSVLIFADILIELHMKVSALCQKILVIDRCWDIIFG